MRGRVGDQDNASFEIKLSTSLNQGTPLRACEPGSWAMDAREGLQGRAWSWSPYGVERESQEAQATLGGRATLSGFGDGAADACAECQPRSFGPSRPGTAGHGTRGMSRGARTRGLVLAFLSRRRGPSEPRRRSSARSRRRRSSALAPDRVHALTAPGPEGPRNTAWFRESASRAESPRPLGRALEPVRRTCGYV